MIILGLGSNIGDKEANILTAIKFLSDNKDIIIDKVSALYRTEPVGVKDQPEFLNAVISIKTALSPHELLKACLSTEQKMGRVRIKRWGPRNVDIDILMYNDVVLDSQDLNLPHPRLCERNFVLIPLADITGKLPVCNGMTANELMAVNKDESKVFFIKEIIMPD